MATFGYSFSGSETDYLNGDTNRIFSCLFTAPATGEITSITALMSGGGSNERIKGLIYDNDGSGGGPGTLLGTGNASGIIGTKGSYSSTFSTPVSMTSGDTIYLSVVLYADPVMYYANVANTHKTTTGNYATPANNPEPLSAYSITDCIYATYTPSGGGGLPLSTAKCYVSML